MTCLRARKISRRPRKSVNPSDSSPSVLSFNSSPPMVTTPDDEKIEQEKKKNPRKGKKQN